MLLTTPKKFKHRDNDLLAQTGVTKAGYLLKRLGTSSLKPHWRWESTFLILNDHCLGYCTEKNNFTRPDRNLLLTASTRVYNQHGEEAVIRIETGCEALFLKGRDAAEIKEWKRAIHLNVQRLTGLARGQFGVKKNGRVVDQFTMLHKECITFHPSYNNTLVIDTVYPISSQTTFAVDGSNIIVKGNEGFTLIAKNDIELKNFAHALGQVISSLQTDGTKCIVTPPQLPIHSGTLMSLDISSMKWTKKYLVVTDDCIYIHGHRRVGFDAARELKFTPNAMLFSTTLKPYSFEVVLFSESLHLAAATSSEKQEWMYIIHKLIPQSSYDLNDPLQSASLERDMNEYPVDFLSTKDPGIILERRGNWAIASVVSDFLSRKVSRGSVLSSIDNKQVALTGFDSVLGKLSMWKAPLKLSFWLSPQKMGWLSMMVSVNRKTWKSAEVVSWEHVYATVSTGILTVYAILKDGKSKKHEMSLYGSAVCLVAAEVVSGMKHCFRVVNGIEDIVLQASSYEDMMDWSTAIVHSISMENGGGVLLEKAKNNEANTIPIQQFQETSIFRGVGDSDGGIKSSIVFAKQIHKTTVVPPITKSKSLDSMAPIPLFEKFDTLNTSRSTDLTELNTTFKTINPTDLSETMQDFANNFFKSFPEGTCKADNVLPLQALRVNDLSCDSIESTGSSCLDTPWLEIDKASSATGSVAMSDEEVIDKYLDLNANNTHLNAHDFSTLLRYNECIEGEAEKMEDMEAGRLGLI